MSADRIDVLAVIDAAIEHHRTRAESISGTAWVSQKAADNLTASRDAVAELIAADREYDAALLDLHAQSGKAADDVNPRRFNEAQARRAAALARVQP